MASGIELPAATTFTGIVASGLSSPDLNVPEDAAAAATGELRTHLAGMVADPSTADLTVMAAAMSKVCCKVLSGEHNRGQRGSSRDCCCCYFCCCRPYRSGDPFYSIASRSRLRACDARAVFAFGA